eukprot:TRINITY_DN5590_c0_g1_i3.p2 TRINITY_DN5590_c0_g1~~TRINITY_DN5590_c0_g1_i3.p2  ORF type:complete len:105 (-),score=19.53 TRINITY_DN5590_c0_g1_i3:127-441(-)
MERAVKKFVSFDFEVFGKVQGVFFRKYTQQKAMELGLVGWVKNTQTKTVIGTVQGPSDKTRAMRTWLTREGSPKSRIDELKVRNEKTIETLEYKAFDVIRDEND